MWHLIDEETYFNQPFLKYLRFSDRVVFFLDRNLPNLERYPKIDNCFAILFAEIIVCIEIIVFLVTTTFLVITKLPHQVVLLFKKKYIKKTENAFPGWPRFWNLLKFFLPKNIRERVYTPSHFNLLNDYLEAKKYHTKSARAWINFCFSVQTFILFADCWRVLLIEKAFTFLLLFLPSEFRDWLSRFTN